MDPDLVLLDAESPRCPQINARSGIQLMPHQLAMILKCMQIEMAGSELTPVHVCKPKHGPGIPAVGTKAQANHGILMDPPGAGKTFVAVCLAAQDVRLDDKRTTVIFAPSHVVNQWGQTVAIVAGAQTPLNQMGMGYPVSRKNPTWIQIKSYSDLMMLFAKPDLIRSYNTIIAPYIYYEQLAPALSQANVHRLMFDEIESNLHFVRTKLQAPNVWFISATIEKALSDGRLVLGPFTLPVDAFKGNVCKCDPAFIADSIRIPHPVMHTLVCQDTLVEECMIPFVAERDPNVALNINASDFSRARVLIAPAGQHANKRLDDRDSLLHALSQCLGQNELVKFHRAMRRVGKCVLCNPNACSCPLHLESQDPVTCEPTHIDPVKIVEDPIATYESENENENEPANQVLQDAGVLDETPHKNTNLRGKKRIHTALSFFQSSSSSAYLDDITLTNTLDATESDGGEECSSTTTDNSISACDQDDNTTEDHTTNKEPSTDSVMVTEYAPVSTVNNTEVLEPVEQMPSVTKMEMLESAILSIVQERRQAGTTPRVLLVSECPGTFGEVCGVLDRHGVKHKPLENGDLENTLVSYHDGSIQVLLYDAAIFGTGLNLQMTTDIVFMHAPSSTYVYEQAIGRAQRPGRTHALHAWFLLHPNELASS